jgi:hypothetical protein
MSRHPDQASLSEQQSRDYNTGRSVVYADIDLTDRLPHEPHGIRAKAEQVNSTDWIVRTIHGPHAERDETGGLYRTVNTEVIHGSTPSKMNIHVRRAVKGAHNDLLKQRPRDA